MSEANINLTDPAAILSLFGPQDQYLKMIRNHYGVAITHRDGKLKIVGEEAAVRQATSLMEALHQRAQQSGGLTLQEVQSALGGIRSHATTPSSDPSEPLPGMASGNGLVSQFAGPRSNSAVEVNLPHMHRKIKPKTEGQAAYIKAIRDHDLTFCRGPAGCGKTYLACCAGCGGPQKPRNPKNCVGPSSSRGGRKLGLSTGGPASQAEPLLATVARCAQ
jgi:phosphate starvation-inducible PhoH-like protein